jgi:hypothetical protein
MKVISLLKKPVRIVRKAYKRNKILTLFVAFVFVVATVGPSVRAIITNSGSIQLSKGLIGWWKFDGNAKDSSPFGNDGTISGTVNPTTDRFGKANSAYDFDGTTGYITTTNNTLPPKYTVSAWIYHTASSGGRLVMSSTDCLTDTQRGLCLNSSYTSRNPSAVLMKSNGTGEIYANGANNATPLNAWAHLAATYDGSSLRVFLNGTQMAIDSYAQASNGTPTYNLTIGKLAGNPFYYFQGKIDDVRYYDRALSSDEITALNEGEGNSSIQTGQGLRSLIGHWNFNGNAKDSSPYGNDATVNGATLTTDRHGNADSAYSFNGTSNYIDTGMTTLPARFTISGWYYTSSSSIQFLASNARDGIDSTQRGFNLMVAYADGGTNYTSYQMWKVDGSGGSGGYGSLASSNLNTWRHLAYTYDGTTQRLYENGVLVDSTSYSQASMGGVSSTTLQIGKLATHSLYYMNGKIDDVRYYADALSADEVGQVYGSYDSSVAVKYDPVEADLIGHWKFNGNARDSTQYGNHGTVYGNTALTTDRQGRANSAYEFDGSFDYIDTGNKMLPPEFTIMAWMYLDTYGTRSIAGNSRNCCESTPTPMRGFYLAGGYSNYPNGHLWGSNGTTEAAVDGPAASSPLGTWSHVALTYDGTVLELYLDGVSQDTASFTQATNGDVSTISLQFGWIPEYSTGFFDGKLDDIRYYSRALNSTEVGVAMNTYDD